MSVRVPADDQAATSGLNPALQAHEDHSHGDAFHGTDPMRSVSVHDPDEGSSWPWIWAIVALACVLVTVYLLL